jgi:hypothetical protein
MSSFARDILRGAILKECRLLLVVAKDVAIDTCSMSSYK